MILTETFRSSHSCPDSSQIGEPVEPNGVSTRGMQKRDQQPAGTPAEAADPARILFAEDSESMRYCVRVHLERAGYAVTTAQDGQAAWEELRTRDYDLLITDHEMPRMTGRELVKRLRLAGAPLPVILVSADVHSFAEGNDELPRLAATLQKPFEIRDLLGAILKTLRNPASEGWKQIPPHGAGLADLEIYLRRLDRAYLGYYPEAHASEVCSPDPRFFRTGNKNNP